MSVTLVGIQKSGKKEGTDTFQVEKQKMMCSPGYYNDDYRVFSQVIEEDPGTYRCEIAIDYEIMDDRTIKTSYAYVTFKVV